MKTKQLTSVATKSLFVLGGIVVPKAIEPLMPIAGSQTGMILRKGAAAAIPGVLASSFLSKQNATLVWLGVGVNALVSILQTQGVAVPGFSGGVGCGGCS